MIYTAVFILASLNWTEMVEKSVTIGIIVGATGGFLFLFAIGIALYCFFRRPKKTIEEPEIALSIVDQGDLPLVDIDSPEQEIMREQHHQSHVLPHVNDMGPIPDIKPTKHPVDYVPFRKSVNKQRFSRSRDSDSSALLNVTFDTYSTSYNIPKYH